MKFSAVLLLAALLGASCMLVAANEPATWATAHCACTKERDVVCGADGTSYLNRCWAECSGTTVEHEGACGKLENDVSDTFCPCPHYDAPVCAVDEATGDFHTYPNGCIAQMCHHAGVVHEGPCEKAELESAADVSGCGCPKERALVCGADGTTYLNECWARCSETFVIHQGPCSRAVENPPCACTKERDVVCGDDGHSYTNACWAACAGTSVAHEGSCKKGLTSSECQKDCPRVLEPVCGMNDKSYANKCRMECDGVELKHEGRCAIHASNDDPAACRAACPRLWGHPICGPNDTMYPSQCFAECAAAGAAAIANSCPPCFSPRIWAPVCDNDGFTWSNKYEMACVPSQTVAHEGECEASSVQ